MFQRIVVPIDDSKHAWDGAVVAASIAEACDAEFELVTVVETATGMSAANADLQRGIEQRGPWATVPAVHAFAPRSEVDRSVGAALARYIEEEDGSMMVMSSSGHGRSAAVLGSVADEILRTSFGPIIVVGPNADTGRPFTGDVIVPVDGSAFSELSLPLAAAWGIALGATPWIVSVVTEASPPDIDVAESSYPHRLAQDLTARSHHDVEFEVLHGPPVAEAICDFADTRAARLVMMSTHGRSGVQRLTTGSVAADVVRHAACPVVLHRPPRFALD